MRNHLQTRLLTGIFLLWVIHALATESSLSSRSCNSTLLHAQYLNPSYAISINIGNEGQKANRQRTEQSC